ncbi:MAG: hypothetical protein A2035_01430 [Nitrospirae bacterium GWA2_42_11]|nr:MAG: hypothetical protein A2035_01430 [Nitrospirae bacterium GWA2_42_11]
MAQILIRNMDDRVVDCLKKRARREGRSLQAEVKFILEQAAKMDMDTAREKLKQFRIRFKERKFSDSVELIREDHKR